MRRAALILFCALIAPQALAESPAPKSPAPSSAAIAPKPGAALTSTAPTTMSQSKFLGLLYAEIARHTPEDNADGEGEVQASFHVNAQGLIDKVSIEKTTNSALGDAVKKILAAVRAPPPPGGEMDISQNFKFH